MGPGLSAAGRRTLGGGGGGWPGLLPPDRLHQLPAPPSQSFPTSRPPLPQGLIGQEWSEGGSYRPSQPSRPGGPGASGRSASHIPEQGSWTFSLQGGGIPTLTPPMVTLVPVTSLGRWRVWAARPAHLAASLPFAASGALTLQAPPCRCSRRTLPREAPPRGGPAPEPACSRRTSACSTAGGRRSAWGLRPAPARKRPRAGRGEQPTWATRPPAASAPADWVPAPSNPGPLPLRGLPSSLLAPKCSRAPPPGPPAPGSASPSPGAHGLALLPLGSPRSCARASWVSP